MSTDKLTQRLEELNTQLASSEKQMTQLLTDKDIINDPQAEAEFNAISEEIYRLAGEIDSIVNAII